MKVLTFLDADAHMHVFKFDTPEDRQNAFMDLLINYLKTDELFPILKEMVGLVLNDPVEQECIFAILPRERIIRGFHLIKLKSLAPMKKTIFEHPIVANDMAEKVYQIVWKNIWLQIWTNMKKL